MQNRNKILGFGLAALIGIIPGIANADHYRYNRDHREDGHRANAIALGAAGLILIAGHEDTLGKIALGAAVVEASRTNPRRRDCDDRGRHRGWRRDRDDYRRDRDDSWWNGGRRDRDDYRRDRDDRCGDRDDRWRDNGDRDGD